MANGEIEITVDTKKATRDIEELAKKATQAMYFVREFAKACRAFADEFENVGEPEKGEG